MPRIPKYKAEINLPSQAGRGATGLRPASEATGTAAPQAMRQLGKQIGAIGEMIYQKKKQQNEQARGLGEDQLELNLQENMGRVKDAFDTAETPQDKLRIFNDIMEVDPETDKYRLKDMHGYGDDFSEVDTKNDPVLRKFSELGWTELGKARWGIKKKAALTRLEGYLAREFDRANFDIFKEKKGLKDQAIKKQLREGLISFEESIGLHRDNYSNNGYSDDVNKPLYEGVVQSATEEYLTAEFKAGNMVVIDEYLSGAYRDELINVFEDNKGIIDEFDSMALIAKGKIVYDPDQPHYMKDGKRNFNLVAADIKKDKSLGQYEKDQLLTRTNVLINRRNYADAKELSGKRSDQKNKFNNLFAEGKVDEALEYAPDMTAYEPWEIKEFQDSIKDNNDPFKGFDPDKVEYIENLFKDMPDNISDEYMELLWTEVEESWGKANEGGINEVQKKGFEARWRAIDKERDKKADPLNSDAYRFAEKEIEKWYGDKGFATKEERIRRQDFTYQLGTIPEEEELSDDEMMKLERQVAQDVRRQKRTMQEHLEGLKKETIDKKDPKLYFDNNIKPIIDAKKKEDFKGWLSDWLFSPGSPSLWQRMTGGDKDDLFSQENLEFTAKENNMTIEEVKKALGIE